MTSIDLNNAVKLPLPKPPQPPACSVTSFPSVFSTVRWQPMRWMISTKTVGLSPRGLLKICRSTPCKPPCTQRDASPIRTMTGVDTLSTPDTLNVLLRDIGLMPKSLQVSNVLQWTQPSCLLLIKWQKYSVTVGTVLVWQPRNLKNYANHQCV